MSTTTTTIYRGTFIAGSSAKFYQADIIEASDGTFTAHLSWGRIGTAGQSQDKYQGPSRDAAVAACQPKINEKRREGYAEETPAAAAPSASAGVAPAPAPKPAAAIIPGLPADLRFVAQNAGEDGDITVAIADPDRYIVEPKYDGMRILAAFLPGGTIELRNRYGERTAKRNPVVEAELARLGTRWPNLYKGSVLDGEIAGLTWADTMHKLASGEAGLVYHVFDAPILCGVDQRNRPLAQRLPDVEFALIGLEQGNPDRPVRQTTRVAARPDLLADIWAAGGEGVIIKDVAAPYVPGDRSAWRKIKQVQTADGVITGFEAGKGKYAGGVGAVILSQYRDGVLVEVCRVSGFSDELRAALEASWIGRVVEFTFQMRTETSYRHPRWERTRDDKSASDCEWAA